jgi:16S rRNA (cytidine1402-2'-O)-methyltransferase
MGRLVIVPTPVGNLEDITLRSIRALKECELILAEDTRTSGKLLKHLEIDTPKRSYHLHNEHKIVEQLVNELAVSDATFCLVSDAGTPAISDPGFLLVRACIENNIEVETLPGATAFVPALVNSGLPCDRFVFEGFLPHKKGRQKRIQALVEETKTMVFYESPYRVIKALTEFSEAFGEDRKCSISREISKLYEETVRGTLTEVKKHFENKAPKGEFVMVIGGKE